MMMPARSRVSSLRGERGVTLVELLIVMAVSAIVATVAYAGLDGATRTDDFTREDAEALVSLRTGMDRLEKELRQARTVYDDSTSTTVRMWVDYDRDSQQDPVERVSWILAAGDSGWELTRDTDAGSGDYFATGNLLSGSQFTYQPAPPETTLVVVRLRADADSDEGSAGVRTLLTEVRLRNAEGG
jgi:prepilin-type N-terminal cleavage/methylation domain-containing protein